MHVHWYTAPHPFRTSIPRGAYHALTQLRIDKELTLNPKLEALNLRFETLNHYTHTELRIEMRGEELATLREQQIDVMFYNDHLREVICYTYCNIIHYTVLQYDK